MFRNVPMEMRKYPQWVCWRYEQHGGRWTKVPYSPDGTRKANVHDSATWGSFTDAIAGATQPGVNGIGFVLTESDPYTGIDIDDKEENPASEAERLVHQKVLQAFCSYTERSVGGRGFHIIIRGKIDGGRDRGHIGIYSSARYLTFSGDVVRNAPIEEYQQQLDALVAQMPAPGADDTLYDIEGVADDGEVHDMALRASNGDKYHQLCNGDWKAMGYPSQSEADLALLSMLAFYSRDNAQVRRLFRYSALGKREKAVKNDVYINRTLKMIRAKEPNPIDFDQAKLSAASIVAASQAPAIAPAMPQSAPLAPAQLVPATPAAIPSKKHTVMGGLGLPPGLMGELVHYFYSTSVRPVAETALVGAIGIMAGVAGRSYNISGVGLNHYLIFIGPTGTGKEGIDSGISELFNSIRPSIARVDEFRGPASFASGQGLVRTLDKQPCFFSVLGEFGLMLKSMSDPRAPQSMTVLRRMLLDLYSKSGAKARLLPTAYSDTEKNTKTIVSPSVTVVGESTPETFFDVIDTNDIADGLIPRFHIIEYKGPRPRRNRNAGISPPASLVQRFQDLCVLALTTQQNSSHANVQMSEDAQELLDAFDIRCDDEINSVGQSGEKQLWNRAHLKALKLAALIAVGCNAHAPVVDAVCAQWAIDFTSHATQALRDKFFNGEAGSGEGRQISDLRKLVEDYFALNTKQMSTYKVKAEMHEAGVIPYRYLVARAGRMASFYSHRMGASAAIKLQMGQMIETGQLVQVDKGTAASKFNTGQALYVVGETW